MIVGMYGNERIEIMTRILVIDSLPSRKKQYIDRDELLLHVMFQILVDFIEKEKPAEVVEWDYDPNSICAWKEMNDLYTWWKAERPNRVDPLDGAEVPPIEFKECEDEKHRGYSEMILPDPLEYPEWKEASEKYYQLKQLWCEEDQRNLHRLVDVRLYLWT
jgi:hypothetical protein